MTKLIIETATNGYIIRDLNDGSMPEETIVAGGEDEITNALDMLWTVNELVGRIGSRYDARRIRIEVRPGDKWIDPKSDEWKDIMGAH